jgi:hypothetical protein
MEILNFIFYLGINYIIFTVLWFLIVSFPKVVLKISINSTLTNYLLKSIQYYLLAAITSLSTMKFHEKHPDFISVYIFLGGFIFFLYLAGKMERNKILSLIKSAINKNSSSKFLKFEPHLIGFAVTLYAFSFSTPILFNNPLNIWFMDSIESIYETPILGSIISFAGFIFLIIMLIKGSKTIKKYWLTLIAYISGKPMPNEPKETSFMDQFNNMKNSMNKEEKIELDDVYVDYEEIEDDEN